MSGPGTGLPRGRAQTSQGKDLCGRRQTEKHGAPFLMIPSHLFMKMSLLKLSSIGSFPIYIGTESVCFFKSENKQKSEH